MLRALVERALGAGIKLLINERGVVSCIFPLPLSIISRGAGAVPDVRRLE